MKRSYLYIFFVLRLICVAVSLCSLFNPECTSHWITPNYKTEHFCLSSLKYGKQAGASAVEHVEEEVDFVHFLSAQEALWTCSSDLHGITASRAECEAVRMKRIK